MNKHLDNVCIMQKYNDSEKVLELREEFRESEAFIKKAVNEYDDNKALISKFEKTLASDSIRLAKMSIINDELVEALKEVIKERDFYFVHPKAKEMINKALKKARE